MRILITICAVIVTVITGGLGAQEAIAQDAAAQSANSVVVYYFHTSQRCVNCHNMEKWTKEVVDNDFADDVNNGKVALRIINTETKGNEHYMADYKLYTKSVVLALVKDGKEIKFENLTKIWKYLGSSEKFKAYIKEEVSKYLKEVS